MAISAFKQFERISDQIGGEAALRLHAFFGGLGRSVYVPTESTPGHILERLLGRESFVDLVRAFSGQTLSIPALDIAPLRNAGRVWALTRKNVSQTLVAGLLDISPARVCQIVKSLELEGFGALADSIVESEGGEL